VATQWNVKNWLDENPEYKYRRERGKGAEYGISFGHFIL
jgi:hypothetical protein